MAGAECAIAAEALRVIVDACRAGYPAEVCGLIGGREGRLEHAFPVPNVADPDPGRCGFVMESRGQLRAMTEIEDAGLELAGIYHSHPRDPAVPSEGDVHLAAYPDAIHVIVSLVDPRAPSARAWRIADGAAAEVTLDRD